ncbi:MAG: 4-alpha-glucanotransferase [Acidobacteriota bacterium]
MTRSRGTRARFSDDYARYCALWAHIHAENPDIWLWTNWPEQFQDPRSHAVEEFAREHSADVRYYKFLQWQLDRQFAEVQDHARSCGMKIGLYHDLALATDQFGADLWANRPFFAKGARVGAPPDELAPSGQDWGFPPPARDVHRASGYELFAQSIRKKCPPRRRATHRPRDAPAVLDSGGVDGRRWDLRSRLR